MDETGAGMNRAPVRRVKAPWRQAKFASYWRGIGSACSGEKERVMNSKAGAGNRLAALVCALMLSAPLGIFGAAAQQAAPAATSASPAAPASPTPNSDAPTATPPVATPPPAANAPAPTPQSATPAPAAGAPAATPPAAAPSTPPAAAAPASPPADSGTPSDDSSGGQFLDMTAHPAAFVGGKANWNEGFSALMGSLNLVRAELAKANLTASGHPIAVFTETDDTGFSYRVMIPIGNAPEGKTELSDSVKLGQTPAGKAMKFEHRGSYEDIDSTYEAITAYLDEKGLEADNLFVEEYLNDVKTPDDPNLQVDIYVLLK
jgi:effector-binding domain-containing protein